MSFLQFIDFARPFGANAVRFRQAISIYLYKCIILYIAVVMGAPLPNISISGKKNISRSEVRACRRVGACTFEAFFFGRFGVGILFFFVCLFETGKYVQHEPWINFFQPVRLILGCFGMYLILDLACKIDIHFSQISQKCFHAI